MSVVSDRVTGQYPISISSSLALEGAMGIHPDHPAGRYKLKDFKHVRANLKTLFRNYYEAIGKENIQNADIQELIIGFYQELIAYKDLVATETNFQTQAQFYVCDYLGIEQRARHALLRGDRTENQILYTKTMKLVVSEVLKNDEEIAKLYRFKIEEEQIGDSVLIHTHFPIDLTTRSYTKLSLLESHTGAIKDKSKWYTKYYNGKELVQIPFREDFLYIFGDSYMFHPLSNVYRKTLLELAKKYNWSFATSRDKIVYGLQTLKDKHLGETLRSYLL